MCAMHSGLFFRAQFVDLVKLTLFGCYHLCSVATELVPELGIDCPFGKMLVFSRAIVHPRDPACRFKTLHGT
jgi:hypothetical protein